MATVLWLAPPPPPSPWHNLACERVHQNNGRAHMLETMGDNAVEQEQEESATHSSLAGGHACGRANEEAAPVSCRLCA